MLMETSAFLELIRFIAVGDVDKFSRQLRTAPELATMTLPAGATRQNSTDFFLTEISHYMYAGDTALHIAAAAFSRPNGENSGVPRSQLSSEESARRRAASLRVRRESIRAAGRGANN